MPAKTQLTGPEKAVLMLLSLEEGVAAPIVAELEPNDVKKMREIAAMMREVPKHALDGLYGEFLDRARVAVAVPKGGIAYLRRLAEKAMGTTRSEELFVGAPASPFERLEKADAQAVAALLEGEHPQIGAAILSQIESSKAAKIVGFCNGTMRTELVSRMAMMTEVPAAILESVAAALAKQLPDGAQATVSVDGVASAASVLKKLGAERSQEVLTALEGESVAEEIKAAMFTMEDLRGLDVRILRNDPEGGPARHARRGDEDRKRRAEGKSLHQHVDARGGSLARRARVARRGATRGRRSGATQRRRCGEITRSEAAE